MQTLTLKRTLANFKVKETLLVLSLSIILPFSVHLTCGAIFAARLLPMFYAPLIAAFLFRPHVAVICGLLAPVLNWLITGQPATDKIFVLTIELVIFALAVCIFSRKWKKFPAALLVLPVLKSPIMSLPGIAVLLLINLFINHLKEDSDGRYKF